MRAIIVSLGLVLSLSVNTTANADPIQEARSLLQDGQPQQALAILTQAKQKLPVQAKLAKWKISLKQTRGYPVEKVLTGERFVYVIGRHPRGSRHSVSLPDKRPSINDGNGIYDFHVTITCVEGRTGKMIWSRQLEGRFSLMLDPNNDNVYCWRRKLYCLSAEKGEIILTKPFPQKKGKVKAINVRGHVLCEQRFHLINDARRAPELTYDLLTGATKPMDVLQAKRLAPDEKRRLVISKSLDGTVLDAKPLGVANPWSYVYPGNLWNEPFWDGEDLMSLNGDNYGHGEVVRLDGETGKVKWRHVLPRGTYCVSRDQLNNGSYQYPWDAIRRVGKNILAIGGEATLYFLNADDGKLKARITPVTSHITRPQVIDDALIVADQQELRAIPLGIIFDREPGNEIDILILQAQCYHALSQSKQALQLLDEMLDQIPEIPEAWRVRAEICKALKQPENEIASHLKYLALTKQNTTEELRNRWGLIQRIPLDTNVISNLKQVNDTIYLGTSTGKFLALSTKTLDILEEKPFPNAVLRVEKKSEIRPVHGYGKKAPSEFVENNDEGAPDGWRMIQGREGFVVRWKGKRYRTIKGGQVEILEAGKVQKFTTTLKDVGTWRIHVSPYGPLGMGAGGVYELDDNLCPAKVLIDLSSRPNARLQRHVWSLADNATSICVLFSNYGEPEIQVWTRDGKRLIHKIELNRPVKETGSRGPVMTMGNGFLYCASELIWLPTSAKKKSWRFGVGNEPGRSIPKIYYQGSNWYGEPIVHNNFLFVPCRDGGLYVFDVALITKNE